MKKSFLVCLSLIGMIIALSACSSSNEPTKETSETVATKEKKTIDVVSEYPFPPFEYEKDGKLTGFDMEVIQAIGKELNWDVNIHKENWDNVFAKVKDGTYDIGISAIGMTDERKKEFSFSKSYFTAYQMIIVKKDNPAKTLKELNGQKIGVQTGTTGHEFVKQTLGENYDKVVVYESMDDGINDFFNGKIDAFISDNSFILDKVKDKDPNTYALLKDPSLDYEYFAMLLQKNNKELQKEVNKGLETIEHNGVYDQIYTKYFGNE